MKKVKNWRFVSTVKLWLKQIIWNFVRPLKHQQTLIFVWKIYILPLQNLSSRLLFIFCIIKASYATCILWVVLRVVLNRLLYKHLLHPVTSETFNAIVIRNITQLRALRAYKKSFRISQKSTKKSYALLALWQNFWWKTKLGVTKLIRERRHLNSNWQQYWNVIAALLATKGRHTPEAIWKCRAIFQFLPTDNVDPAYFYSNA